MQRNSTPMICQLVWLLPVFAPKVLQFLQCSRRNPKDRSRKFGRGLLEEGSLGMRLLRPSLTTTGAPNCWDGSGRDGVSLDDELVVSLAVFFSTLNWYVIRLLGSFIFWEEHQKSLNTKIRSPKKVSVLGGSSQDGSTYTWLISTVN